MEYIRLKLRKKKAVKVGRKRRPPKPHCAYCRWCSKCFFYHLKDKKRRGYCCKDHYLRDRWVGYTILQPLGVEDSFLRTYKSGILKPETKPEMISTLNPHSIIYQRPARENPHTPLWMFSKMAGGGFHGKKIELDHKNYLKVDMWN